MKITNILITITIFVLALSTSVLNAQTGSTTAIFSFNSTYCGTSLDEPCTLKDTTNWYEGNAPTNGDKIIIDLSQSDYHGKVYILGQSLNINLTSVLIVGGTNSTPVVSFEKSSITLSGELNVTNSALVFDNSLAPKGYEIILNGGWTVVNSSVTGTTTYLVSEGIKLDTSSSFTFAHGSSVFIYGLCTFWTQPSFTDESIFTVSAIGETTPGFSFFNQGINSDNLVTIGFATLYGKSNLLHVTVTDKIHVGGTIIIQGQLKFTADGTFASIVPNSKLVIAGQTPLTIENTILSGGSLVINNPFANVTTVSGNGTVLFDIVKLGSNEPANFLSGADGSSNLTVTIAGSANLFISSSSFLALDDAPSQYNPGDNKAVGMVTLEQVNLIGYINTNRTLITMVDGSITTLEGPTATLIQNQDLILLGTLSLNGTNLYGSVTTMDALAYIGMNDDFITGNVDLMAGRLHPSGVCIVGGDLIVSNGGFLDFDETSGTLGVNGNYEMDGSSTIYISQVMLSNTASILTVDGDLVLNGTLILDVTLDNISDGDVYNIIDYEGQLLGEFSAINAFQNGKQLTSFSFKIQNSNSKISVVLADLSISPNHKLPGWAVFLIILSIFIVIGAGFYGFIRYKKRSGYLPVN